MAGDGRRQVQRTRGSSRGRTGSGVAAASERRSGEQQVLTLQRQVGNAALSQLLTGGGVLQRFEESEHLQIGEEGTRGAHGETQMVQLADDYRVSYGEMVAMAGDHFESIDQMRALAARPGTGAGTREELEYVRVVEIHKGSPNGFSAGAVSAAKKRYYDLALRNRSHFPSPVAGDEKRSTEDKADDTVAEYRRRWGSRFDDLEKKLPPNAVAGYHRNHVRALYEAYFGGLTGTSVESALAVDAFSAHYLTDAFAGGHLMTPRVSIVERWNKLVPMFNYNLKGFIANEMARKLQSHYKVFTTDQLYQDIPFPVSLFKNDALKTVTDKLDEKGTITFGDVVSGAIHDFYNSKGAQADILGQTVTLMGDGHLGQGAEKQFAVDAVRLSSQDVFLAWEAGQRHDDPLQLYDRLVQDDLFAAEELIPKARPKSEQAGPAQWDFQSVDELLADSGFREAFGIFAQNKATEFAEVGKSLDAVQGKAFEEAILSRFKTPQSAIALLRDVIDWVPDTGGGLFGHNQDDNALDYYKLAKKQGNVRTLTYTQKQKIIGDLLDGATIGEEEDAIVDLLATNDAEARQLIRHFGWSRLHDDIDDWFGEQFADRFPKSAYGH